MRIKYISDKQILRLEWLVSRTAILREEMEKHINVATDMAKEIKEHEKELDKLVASGNGPKRK